MEDLEYISAGMPVNLEGFDTADDGAVVLHLPSDCARQLLTRLPASDEFISSAQADGEEKATGNRTGEGTGDQTFDKTGDELCAFYNSPTGTPWKALAQNGDAMARQLGITSADVICVPVTLCHSFGMSAALAALASGSTLVLPSPTPEPAHTLSALEEHGATILVADTHSLKALAGERAAASLRGGFVKVGSGDMLGLGNPVEWSGVGLTTVGKLA